VACDGCPLSSDTEGITLGNVATVTLQCAGLLVGTASNELTVGWCVWWCSVTSKRLAGWVWCLPWLGWVSSANGITRLGVSRLAGQGTSLTSGGTLTFTVDTVGWVWWFLLADSGSDVDINTVDTPVVAEGVLTPHFSVPDFVLLSLGEASTCLVGDTEVWSVVSLEWVSLG